MQLKNDYQYRKEREFSYTSIENSAEYIRKLREEESFTLDGKLKNGREFLKELFE